MIPLSAHCRLGRDPRQIDGRSRTMEARWVDGVEAALLAAVEASGRRVVVVPEAL